MKHFPILLLPMAIAGSSLLSGCGEPSMAQSNGTMNQAPTTTADKATTMADDDHDLMATIKGWPDKPREAVMMMQKKYGEPEIVSEHLICWKDTGPFKFTKIMDKELPHDFPISHTDFMEQGLDFKVPAEKVGELAMYDGSIIVDRTKGCLSARCDKEENNILALNLAHDVIMGKRTAAEARKFFAATVAEAMAGGKPAYMQKLNFGSGTNTGDRDMLVAAEGMKK